MRDVLIDSQEFVEISQLSFKRRVVLMVSVARAASGHRGIVIATLSWGAGSIVVALSLFMILGIGVDQGWFSALPQIGRGALLFGVPLLTPVLTYTPLRRYTTPRLRQLMHGLLVNRHGQPLMCFNCGYPLRGNATRQAGQCAECGFTIAALPEHERIGSGNDHDRRPRRMRGVLRMVFSASRFRLGRRA